MSHQRAARAACLALLAGCLAIAPAARAQAGSRPHDRDTSWVSRSVLYEVFVQDFSDRGDFRGVIDGLDLVQAAGANVLWIMPVHPIGVEGRKGTLGSPYAASDFRAINPAYGTGADFRALVDAVHARGLKIILDWVPDHTSLDNPWVKEHPDFYFRNDSGGPSVPRDPDGKLTDWNDVVQLDYGKPAVRQEMIATMRWWLTEYGLDGFRVDAAGFIPYPFWAEAIPALRSAVPRRLLLLAEWGDPEIHRTGFDLTYAWDTYRRLKAVWKGAPASSLVREELPDLKQLPPGGMRMRFTTNHDETAWDNPPVTIFGRGAGARAAFVAMVLLPGRPVVYNGQEVESPQKLPLFEREVVDWQQPEADSARAFYARVLQLTRTEPDLIAGELREVTTTAPDDLIAYARGNLVVLVNARSRPVRARVRGVDGMHDLLSHLIQRGDTVSLPSYGALVLQRKAP